MTYDIFSKTVPAMPKPSKGTNFIKFILSKASKDMQEPLVPMCIPALAAHLSEVSFTYSDNKKIRNLRTDGAFDRVFGHINLC